ncbi:nitroreductase family protein [Clostridium magnum DSM 2767]|uniref:Nitroreductase family protein n=2 Tax=Clostridium magnum TaxID=33954 RepID=A0A161YKA8_9CLOT|nr:nitroreductase family protein [Clostridium magnum DSM 2767]SHJ01023.1 Nitroreductase family protein [Clostridium magnum DSM 2767]
MSCGQCVAVCPKEALYNAKTPLANQVVKDIKNFDENTAAQFLRSRRSIRSYQEKAVPRNEVHKILDIARMAPSGCNTQEISYHVVDDPDLLHKISEVIIDWTERVLIKSPAIIGSKYFDNIAMTIDIYHETGEDVVLRSAPCLIMAIADKDFAIGHENSYLSFAYAQLFAK